MKLLVFGSTGSIGMELVKQALSQHHQVTAFTRNPAQVDLAHPNLTKFAGDVMNQKSVTSAVAGHDAVLCALGGGIRSKVRSAGTLNIIRAMEEAGVNRFICQTTLGVGDSQGNLNYFWKYLMFGLLLRPMFKDHVLQERYIKESPLDWTVVRPAAFTDEPASSAYRHGFSGTDKTLTLKISRSDVASFMLNQLTDLTYLHKTPGLSY